MQSNVDCIMDDLNEFPDSWVELYNPDNTTINSEAYRLGTTPVSKEASQIFLTSFGPKGHLVVFCSKKDEKNNLPFKLESGKDCKLYLFHGTNLIDSLPYGMKKQPAPNIAFGRETDGSETWGYQKAPTPNAVNCGVVYDHSKILEDPIFSVPGRVSKNSSSFSLELSVPEYSPEGTVIRYTLDDYTEPDENSTLYTGPITIKGTHVVRAKLFCEGYLSPRSVTQSYISFPREITLPVVSVVTNPDYFFDSKIGIYVEGNYSSNKKNYNYNWHRPVNFELFDTPNEESVLNQLCETRVTGGASRDWKLKSLGFYADKRFGKKKFDYEFFPDQCPELTDYKSIMMRNSGNDCDYLYMRDAIMQRSMAQNVDMDWQAWSPAIFYLNGEYKGMLNIRERSNEANVYTHYDHLEDIVMVENNSQLKRGNWDDWQAFVDFYSEEGHTYEEFDEVLDLTEYMNVMIMNLYYVNLDFPGNNLMFWRPNAEGGKWRIIAKDTDFGLGLYGRDANYKIFDWLYNPNYDANNAWANEPQMTLLFRHLMENERAKNEFIDRCAIYLGDFLNFDRVWEIWEPMYELTKYEYPNHRKLFNEWWPNYNDELKNAKNWLKKRFDYFYQQVANYGETGSPVKLYINNALSENDLEGINVTFNGIKLTRNNFSGKYFAGKEVTLTGENVSGWEVTVKKSGNKAETSEVSGSTYQFTMPTCTQLTITAKMGGSGIEEIGGNENVGYVEIYDETGRRIPELQRGYNIVKTSSGVSKKIWMEE